MTGERDANRSALEDTQPISIVTEVYDDESGWWQQFGDAERMPPMS